MKGNRSRDSERKRHFGFEDVGFATGRHRMRKRKIRHWRRRRRWHCSERNGRGSHDGKERDGEDGRLVERRGEGGTTGVGEE